MEKDYFEIVYVIKNKINGRKYYGVTGNIKQRFYNHFKKLRRGIHENSALQKDFNEYGLEGFISDVVDFDDDREYVLFREKQLIQGNPNCYNVVNNSERAKKDGVKLGRPKTNINNDEFIKAYDRWKAGEIKAVDAMKEANVSKTAFYRLVKQRRGEPMKIKEILELTKTMKIDVIAKEHLSIGEKKARAVLKQVGCTYQAGKRGWIYKGDKPEVLERSIYDFCTPTADKKRTNERKNIPTKERKNDKIKEAIKETTKERKNSMRKRASFDIDTELLKELKIFAIKEEKNVYEIVEQAIKEHLKGKS